MSEKGGNTQNNVDIKLIIGTFIAVLAGAVFILGLVYLGIQLSTRDFTKRITDASQQGGEKIVELKSVAYETQYGFYNIPDDADYGNYLIQQYDSESGFHRYVKIESMTQLRDFMLQYNKLKQSPNDIIATLNIDESFFGSGSVIAVVFEDQGLTSASIDSVTRDENYDITISAHSAAPLDTTTPSGIVAFIKVANIQPNNITLNFNQDYYENN